ncbi:carbonic anhydrase [Thermodesulfobacteriota bacterium]
MVLGHSECGAVGATIQGKELEGHLPCLTSAIQPVVNKVKGNDGNLADNVVRENALMVAEQIKENGSGFKELIADGKLLVVAACYDMETGLVEILQ